MVINFVTIYLFRAKWYDSKCDSKHALAAFVEAVETYDPDVIMGPPCSTGNDVITTSWHFIFFGIHLVSFVDVKQTRYSFIVNE
jgi:hypothetical protein